MAKFTKKEQQIRIDHARQLYCKGFDVETIADIIGDATPSTISRWARDNNFDQSKRSQVIALSEIRNSILESYSDLLDGKKPKITPDQASKYAIAFERFSSKKQVLSYMYESYEMLTEQYQLAIQEGKTKTDKANAFEALQTLRSRMETVINKLNKEVLGDA